MSRRAPRSRNTRRIPQILATFAAAAAMVIGVLVPTTAAVAAPAGPVPARDVKATLVGFTPGNIISDAVFTNRDSMTEAQIQSFFNSKVPRCLGGSDQYGPRVCLKDYKITSVNRPADKYCNGYTGAANETAARIIYRVSQSCGINPQVLIVMLQKEQSLVTSTSPTAPRYWSALGQGCPDSGVSCDPAYVGFFHQIYGAARQMQIYMEGRYFTYYAPGKTWNIYWHPPKLVNGKWVYTCGSGPVYVENKATSALYYYTPYQPNAAAIRAGYGEGDDCSAYGNRNFYNYFTDWFGSTQASGPGEGSLAISKAWAEAGGKTGSWGNRLDAPACSGSVACGHVFEKVIAYWQPGQGILLSTGTIAQWARSQGVANVGYPNSAPVTVSENGGGVAQSFTKVLVNAGPSGVFAVSGLTRDEHAELGGVRQATGWPISAKTCATGGDNCVQSFQNAVISEVGGHAWSVADGDVLKKYRATGGPQGQLGIPTSTLVSSSASGGGQEQAFTSGAIAKTSSGTFSMIGAFRVAHSRAGGVSGQLGWVTGDAVCGQPGGGCSQSYQKGAVHSATSGGSPYFVSGPIATFYQSNGGPGGSLGYPVSDTIPVSANGGGVAQAFAGGLVNAGPAGAFLMTGAIRDAHGKAGGVGGSLGWPTAAQKCGLPGGGCSQSFQNGTIYVVNGSAKVVATGPIATFYQSNGGPGGSLGYPVSDTIPVSANGGGVAQAFAGGLVNAGPAGAFLMTGAIRDAHGKAGGVGGSLGWPTAAQKCGLPGGGCSQSFQNGTIYVVNGSAKVVATGPIATFYQSNGGPGGSLGYPVSDTIPVSANGGGVAQAFAGGLVNAGPAGAFLMTGAIRDAHGKAGGVGGSLGWPTAAQKCGLPGGGCSQSFQNGTIYVVNGSAKVVATGPIATFYQSNGGPGGSLGYPVSDTIPVSANGGGVAQAFAGGLVNAGPAGAFLMTGAIRDAHGKAGGVGGSLGWPTAAQKCGLPGGGCSQSFQNGTITVDAAGKATISR